MRSLSNSPERGQPAPYSSVESERLGRVDGRSYRVVVEKCLHADGHQALPGGVCKRKSHAAVGTKKGHHHRGYSTNTTNGQWQAGTRSRRQGEWIEGGGHALAPPLVSDLKYNNVAQDLPTCFCARPRWPFSTHILRCLARRRPARNH